MIIPGITQPDILAAMSQMRVDVSPLAQLAQQYAKNARSDAFFGNPANTAGLDPTLVALAQNERSPELLRRAMENAPELALRRAANAREEAMAPLSRAATAASTASTIGGERRADAMAPLTMDASRASTDHTRTATGIASAAERRAVAMHPLEVDAARDRTIRGRFDAIDEATRRATSDMVPGAPVPSAYRPAISPTAGPPPPTPGYGEMRFDRREAVYPSFAESTGVPGSYAGDSPMPRGPLPPETGPAAAPRPPVDERRLTFGLTGVLPAPAEAISWRNLKPGEVDLGVDKTGTVVRRLEGGPKPPEPKIVEAITEADSAIRAGIGARPILARLMELNSTAYAGPTAGMRGTAAGLVGGRAGVDTGEMENLLLQQTLSSLKSTFGGNPTEGERAILLQVQGAVNQSRDVRQRIFEAAQVLVERRIASETERATAMRSGDFMKPGYAPPGTAPAGGARVEPKVWQLLGPEKQAEVYKRVMAAPTPETMNAVRVELGEEALKQILGRIDRSRRAGPGVPPWMIR